MAILRVLLLQTRPKGMPLYFSLPSVAQKTELSGGKTHKPESESPLEPWEGAAWDPVGAGGWGLGTGLQNCEKRTSVSLSYPLCGHLLRAVVPGVHKRSINSSNNDYYTYYQT